MYKSREKIIFKIYFPPKKKCGICRNQFLSIYLKCK